MPNYDPEPSYLRVLPRTSGWKVINKRSTTLASRDTKGDALEVAKRKLKSRGRTYYLGILVYDSEGKKQRCITNSDGVKDWMDENSQNIHWRGE